MKTKLLQVVVGLMVLAPSVWASGLVFDSVTEGKQVREFPIKHLDAFDIWHVLTILQKGSPKLSMWDSHANTVIVKASKEQQEFVSRLLDAYDVEPNSNESVRNHLALRLYSSKTNSSEELKKSIPQSAMKYLKFFEISPFDAGKNALLVLVGTGISVERAMTTIKQIDSERL